MGTFRKFELDNTDLRTAEVVREYVSESQYAGGFADEMGRDQLFEDVLRYGRETGRVMDHMVLEVLVDRVN